VKNPNGRQTENKINKSIFSPATHTHTHTHTCVLLLPVITKSRKKKNFFPGIRERRGRGKTIAITIRSVATFPTFRGSCVAVQQHTLTFFSRRYTYNLQVSDGATVKVVEYERGSNELHHPV
jgi:hypothetical protein